MTKVPAGVFVAISLTLAGSAFGQDPDANRRRGPRSTDIREGRPSQQAAQAQKGADVYRNCHKSVVSISVTTHAYPLPRLNLRGVTETLSGAVAERIEGTGFLVSHEGHIATTYDLVRNAHEVKVRFCDGSERLAEVSGLDHTIRLGVVRADAPATAKPVGTATRMTSGVPVMGWFFGATATPGEPSVSVLQAQPVHRYASPYDRYLSGPTDLAPGAAGGPLVGPEGELLGMAVCSVQRKPREGLRSLGGNVAATTLFIQGGDVHSAVRAIRAHGRVPRPLLGVVLRAGNHVDLLVENGPAERAGLKEGDQVLALAGRPVQNPDDVTRSLLRRRIGEKVVVRVRRGEERQNVTVELADVPTPSAPKTRPLPGANLAVEALPLDDGVNIQFTVSVTSVAERSLLAQAGLRIGDRIMSVNGLDPFRFLARHRFRPSREPPREVEVSRDGTLHVLDLRE